MRTNPDDSRRFASCAPVGGGGGAARDAGPHLARGRRGLVGEQGWTARVESCGETTRSAFYPETLSLKRKTHSALQFDAAERTAQRWPAERSPPRGRSFLASSLFCLFFSWTPGNNLALERRLRWSAYVEPGNYGLAVNSSGGDSSFLLRKKGAKRRKKKNTQTQKTCITKMRTS